MGAWTKSKNEYIYARANGFRKLPGISQSAILPRVSDHTQFEFDVLDLQTLPITMQCEDYNLPK